MNKNTTQHNGRTYGNAWLYALLIKLLKVIDVKVFYVFAAVFVVPLTLFLSKGAKIAFDYYNKRRHLTWLKSWIATYKNHCLFAQTVIDKFAMYAGRYFKFEYDGLDFYNAIQRQEGALLQLSAHIGCSEILGYTLHRIKTFNVLVDGAETPALMKYRNKSFAQTNIKMIPVGDGNRPSERITEAFERGEIVGVFADRYADANKTITSKLFGYETKLAKGVFSLAVTRGIDVVMVNAMKEHNGFYKAFFTRLSYDKSLSPKQQRQQLADAYTAEIERLLGIYPLQWFNYFDLWQ